MSFSFNNAALSDSASFATSLHQDFFPGGKTPVKNTSASKSRPMIGQTLSTRTLSDVINGDAFFRSPKYAIASMNKSVSSSLNTLITGSGSIATAGTSENGTNVTVSSPESQGETAGGAKLTGGDAINRIFANSLAGKNFSNSFVGDSIANLQQLSIGNYSTDGVGTGDETSAEDGVPSVEPQSGGMRNVALLSEMSEEEKGWYQERIALLRSKYPNSFGDTSFAFDIANTYAADGTTVYNGEDTYFPKAIVGDSQRIISKDIILQGSVNAYVAPALIELIIFLHGKGTIIGGGFDAGRALKKDVINGKVWLSDHSSGRAVDIFSVGNINSDPINLRPGVSRVVYDDALYMLLDNLADAPAYLLPDLLGIHQDYAVNYGVNDKGNEDVNTCVLKIGRPWLEYVNFFADNRDNAHTNHIHLSFSGMRAGKYTGPGGQMIPAGIVDDGSAETAAPPGFVYIPGIGTVPDTRSTVPLTTLTKNYYNDWGANLGQDAVYELLHTTVCGKETAAIMTAITVRESGGGCPTSCNPKTLSGDFMSLGIFQINMGAGGFREYSNGTIGRKSSDGSAHGTKTYELTEGTTKEKMQGWQLASKNWTTVYPTEQAPTQDNYNEKLNEKYKLELFYAKGSHNGAVEKLRELVDHRVWIPMNQAYMFWTLVTKQTPYYGSPKLGTTPETGYIFAAWGDNYKDPYGWLGGVKFEHAVRVYVNSGGTEAALKQWVKDVYSLSAGTQNTNSAKYIDRWLNGEYLVND